MQKSKVIATEKYTHSNLSGTRGGPNPETRTQNPLAVKNSRCGSESCWWPLPLCSLALSKQVRFQQPSSRMWLFAQGLAVQNWSPPSKTSLFQIISKIKIRCHALLSLLCFPFDLLLWVKPPQTYLTAAHFMKPVLPKRNLSYNETEMSKAGCDVYNSAGSRQSQRLLFSLPIRTVFLTYFVFLMPKIVVAYWEI